MARLCQIAAVSASRRLGDPGADAVDAASAVELEVKLAFEGVADRLDELADRFKHVFIGARCAVAVGRAQQGGGPLGEEPSAETYPLSAMIVNLDRVAVRLGS